MRKIYRPQEILVLKAPVEFAYISIAWNHDLKFDNVENSCGLYLNGNCELLEFICASYGTRTRVITNYEEVAERGYKIDASYFVGIHNHPGSAVAKPSENDIKAYLNEWDIYYRT